MRVFVSVFLCVRLWSICVVVVFVCVVCVRLLVCVGWSEAFCLFGPPKNTWDIFGGIGSEI